MSFSPSDEFNPYHKWLGIPPDVCPPNHYRLLGLEAFEQDPEVIATAADRQMSHIKSFSTGPYARVSQRLLNELAQARIGLLNAETKERYDAQLRAELAPPSPAVAPVQVPAAPLSLDHAPANEPAQFVPVRRRRRRKKTSLAPLVLVLFGIGVVAGLLYYAATQAPVADLNENATAANEASEAKGTTPSPIGSDASSTSPRESGNGDSADMRGIPEHPVPNQPDQAPNQPDAAPAPNPRGRPDFPPPASQSPGRTTPRPDPFDPDSPRDLLDDLPAYFALPELLETGVVEIARMAGSSAPLPIDLELVVADYIARSPRQVFLHMGELGEWLAFDEPPEIRRQLLESGESAAALPFAKIKYAEGRLVFQWMHDPSQRGQEQRLRHCLLRIKRGTEERVVQLREPVEESAPINVGRLEEKFLKVIETNLLEPLPPTGAILLTINPSPQLPATKPNQGDPDRLAQDEQLFLQFQRPSYAGIGAYWQLRGRRLTIGISPGFQLESAPNDIIVLSRSKVTEAQSKLVDAARRTEKDHAQRVNARGRLQSNLTAANNMNIRLPGGGTTPNLIAQKKAAIDKAQRDIAANEARITQLVELGKAIKSDIDSRIPALTRLVDDLEDNALIGFELYVPAGDERVILYRQGDNTND